MSNNVKRMLIIIGVVVSWIFLLQCLDLAEAKDPEYPTKPITFYIPWGAGGNTDTAGRAITEATSKFLGQPFTPFNKPGGAGTIASMAVMNAKPDGYTLGVNVGSITLMLPHTKECPYKDLSGFTLIMNFAKQTFPLIVRSDAPWKTWKEFIEWAKKKPRDAKIGISGPKSATPMGITLWEAEQKENVEFAYLIYKGGGQVLSAVLGGHINMYAVATTISTMQFLKEGKLRILAYLSKEKIPGYENVPNFKELYGVEAPSLLGVWGPKGLPDYVLQKLDNAFAKGVSEPDFVKTLNRMNTPVVYMNRVEVNNYVREMFPRVGKIMKVLRAEEAARGKK